MHIFLQTSHLVRSPWRRLLLAATCALAALSGDGNAVNAQRDERIRPKSISSVFKTIKTESVRVTMLLNGTLAGKPIKNVPLQIDINLDHITNDAAVTFSGSGLKLALNDVPLLNGARSVSMVYASGVTYSAINGPKPACEHEQDDSVKANNVVEPFTPNVLLKRMNIDAQNFSGRYRSTERIGGESSRHYAVDAPQGDLGAAQIWVASPQGHITKAELTVPMTEDDPESIFAGFAGTIRITYTLLGINKPLSISVPAVCKRTV
jgi:hypothetical protein